MPTSPSWKARTDGGIEQVRVRIDDAFGDADSIAVQGVYSGRIRSAPRPFAVPIATVLHLRDGLVAEDVDYYNLADVLRQSGLSPDWTPPPRG